MTAITPCLTVSDVDAALKFYETVFGLTRKMAMPGPDGKTMHAELLHGGSVIMLGAVSEQCGNGVPDAKAKPAFSLYLFVENVDELHATAVKGGCTSQHAPADMPWGARMCSLVDPFGHHWSFGTHIRVVSDEECKAAIDEMMKQKAHA
jgi:PhnB protein